MANTTEQNSTHDSCDCPAAKVEAERIRMGFGEVLPLSSEEIEILLRHRAKVSRRSSPLGVLVSRLLIGAALLIVGIAVLSYVQLLHFQAAGFKGEPPYLLFNVLKLMGGE